MQVGSGSVPFLFKCHNDRFNSTYPLLHNLLHHVDLCGLDDHVRLDAMHFDLKCNFILIIKLNFNNINH